MHDNDLFDGGRTFGLFIHFHMIEQLNDSPAYFFRLPEATSRRRFSPMAMARLV